MKKLILKITFVVIAMLALTAVSRADTLQICIIVHIYDLCSPAPPPGTEYCIKINIGAGTESICQYERCDVPGGVDYPVSYYCTNWITIAEEPDYSLTVSAQREVGGPCYGSTSQDGKYYYEFDCPATLTARVYLH
jgi:hypothetical protein